MKKQLVHYRGSWLLAAFLFLTPAFAAAFDTQLAGFWKADVTTAHGKWDFYWAITQEGKYTVAVVGTTDIPNEIGIMKAEDGKFGLISSVGRIDKGTYEFKGADEFTFKGRKGSLVYHRIPTGTPQTAEPGSFNAYRQAADKLAQSIGPSFRFFHAAIMGTDEGGKVAYQAVSFFYCAPNPGLNYTGRNGDWIVLIINSGPEGAVKNGFQDGAPYFKPQLPAPQVVSEQEAFETLAAHGTNMPKDDMDLELLLLGVGADEGVPDKFMEDYQRIGAVVNIKDRDDLTGRWVWRLMVVHKTYQGKEFNDKAMASNAQSVYHFKTDYVYVDALTGKPL